MVTNCDHLSRLRFSAVLPLAFTEHRAIMAASVLNSSRAIEMSVFVVRAFVRLRDVARTNAEIGKHLALLDLWSIRLALVFADTPVEPRGSGPLGLCEVSNLS